jgi:hypothetical protein
VFEEAGSPRNWSFLRFGIAAASRDQEMTGLFTPRCRELHRSLEV